MLFTQSPDEIKDYFNVSESALNCVHSALRLAGKKTVEKILDLPCGYGRVLRSLAKDFPTAQLTACDIEKDGVDFCVETFGAAGNYSNTDITKIDLPRDFDLIWCGSLLTHLDAKSSKQFIDFFLDHMAADGVLLFTLHGRFTLEKQKFGYEYIEFDKFKKIEKDYLKKGYGYQDYNAGAAYGVSVTSLQWMMNYIAERSDITLLYYSEKCWNNDQDVVAIHKRAIGQSEIDTYHKAIPQFDIPTDNASIRYAIDTVYDFDYKGDKRFVLNGWGLLNDDDSTDCQKYIILKGPSGTCVYQTETMPRPDVTAAFNNKHNYDESGFRCRLSTAGLRKGTYQIGMLIIKDKNIGISFTKGLKLAV